MKHKVLRNLNLPINCPHQKTDQKGYVNCTKNDSTISYCTNPCPYKATDSSYTVQFAIRFFRVEKKRVLFHEHRNKPVLTMFPSFQNLIADCKVESEGDCPND